MIKRLIFYVIILVAAITAGLWLSHDPGYVMLAYRKWSIETSLWFFIFIVAIVVLVFWAFLNVLSNAFRAPWHVQGWNKRRRTAKAHSLTSDGVLALHEGEWKTAESLLIRGVESSAIPVVNYLSAARAAQEQLAYKRRDNYLNLALKTDKKEKLAVNLLRAQVQLEHHQLDEAKLTLRDLKSAAPKHVYVLKLLFEFHIATKNWRRQLALIPLLQKNNVLDEDDLNHQAAIAVKHALQDPNNSLEDVETLWQELAKPLRQKTPIVIAYINALIDYKQHDKAAKLITQSLKQDWRDDIVKLFARVQLDDAERQLDMIDGWLQKQTASATLYETTAAVAIHAKAWAIAKTYAERALRLERTPNAYAILALAAEQLGEEALMTSALRQGLLLQCGAALGLNKG